VPIPSSAAAFGDGDIPALMADMAIAITVGTVAGVGLLDEADRILVQDEERGQVEVLATTLTVQTSAFPAAAIGQSVAIGARNFTVRDRARIADGGLTKLVLSLVTVPSYQPSNLPQFAFADGETPAGVVNGVNVTFTLAQAPNPAASLILVMNGSVLQEGEDYTLSGGTITFLTAPMTGAQLEAWYRY
jgi:hypothetical protein